MKSTNNKLTTLLSSIIIAFGIMLSITSSANATWDTNYTTTNSVCSVYKDNADKYKQLAENYLSKYNSTHCYTYYINYLCYTKKYEYFKQKNDQCKLHIKNVDCNKYKTLAEQFKSCATAYKVYADKYLALYNKCGWSCYNYYYKLYKDKYDYNMNLYTENINKFGTCQATYYLGSVFGDILVAGNAQAGVTVVLTDEDGNTYTAVTDANGTFTFTDITKGDATIVIDKTTLPDGVVLAEGEERYENINVTANNSLNIGRTEYSSAITTGSIHGSVYDDENENGQKDADEVGVADINITIVDAENNTYTVQTDNNGNYTKSGLAEGEFTVSVNVNTIPEGTTLTAGVNPNTVVVVANADTDAGNDGYTVVEAVGSIHGSVYADENENGQKDTREVGVADINITIVDAENNTYTVQTDNNGNYTKSGLAEGEFTVSVDVNTIPEGTTLTAGVNPNTVFVVANADTDAGNDGYTFNEDVKP